MITTLKTAPVLKPLTVEELKWHLYIVGDTTWDSHLETLIDAATAWVEQYMCRKLITQTWYAYYDSFPNGDMYIPFGNLSSVTAIKYTDIDDAELTLSSANYYVDTKSVPGRIVLKDGEVWPTTTLRPYNPVEVEFITGYGATYASVPADIKHAMKLLIGHWHENRESVIVSSMTVQNVENTVNSLLYRHRVWRWAI